MLRPAAHLFQFAVATVLLLLAQVGVADATPTFTTWSAQNIQFNCLAAFGPGLPDCSLVGTVTTISPDPNAGSGTTTYSTNLTLDTPWGNFPLNYSGCADPSNINCNGDLHVTSLTPSSPRCPCPAYPSLPAGYVAQAWAQVSLGVGYNTAWGTPPGSNAAPVAPGAASTVQSQAWPPTQGYQIPGGDFVNGGGGRALPGGSFIPVGSTPPPTVQQLAAMAGATWGTPLSLGSTPNGTGNFSVLQSNATPADQLTNVSVFVSGDPNVGGQIVIAAAGLLQSALNPTGYAPANLYADASFASGTPTSAYSNAVNYIASLVNYYSTTYPNAQITLTGASEGGGIVSVVGNAANIQTVTFAAPGAGALAPSFSLSFPNPISTPSSQIVNYRSYGDVLSLVGRPIGSQITLTNASIQQSVDAYGTASATQENLLQLFHSPTLLQGLLQNGPTTPGALGTWGATNFPSTALPNPTTTSAPGQLGPNYVSNLITPATNVAIAIAQFISNAINTVPALVQQFTMNLSSFVNQYLDPPPGYHYSLVSNSGSPLFASITLPITIGIGGDVAGWDLTYFTDGGTTGTETSSTGVFDLGPGVDRVDFFPIDPLGDPTFYDTLLLVGVTYDGPGTFSGTITTDLAPFGVPEPSSVALLLPGMLLVWGCWSPKRWFSARHRRTWVMQRGPGEQGQFPADADRVPHR